MALASFPPAPAAAAGVFSGCTVLNPSPVLGTQTMSVVIPGLSPGFRWRAGNLASRQAAGEWIRSMTSPLDNDRPMPVQMVPMLDDGTNFQFLLPAQIDSDITVWQ